MRDAIQRRVQNPAKHLKWSKIKFFSKKTSYALHTFFMRSCFFAHFNVFGCYLAILDKAFVDLFTF